MRSFYVAAVLYAVLIDIKSLNLQLFASMGANAKRLPCQREHLAVWSSSRVGSLLQASGDLRLANFLEIPQHAWRIALLSSQNIFINLVNLGFTFALRFCVNLSRRSRFGVFSRVTNV